MAAAAHQQAELRQDAGEVEGEARDGVVSVAAEGRVGGDRVGAALNDSPNLP